MERQRAKQKIRKEEEKTRIREKKRKLMKIATNAKKKRKR